MTAVSLIAFIIIIWSIATGRQSALATFLSRLSPPAALARWLAVALVPLYAAQIGVLVIATRVGSATSRYAWMRTLPIATYDRREKGEPFADVFAGFDLGIGVCETVALAIVFLSLRHRATLFDKRFVLSIACALALLSLLAPAMSTADPYEYVATGILGFHAYAPPAGAFLGTIYEPYRKLVPLDGVIYGPLWVLIDMGQTSLGSSVYEKIEAIRATNVIFVTIFLALLARANVSRAALAGFAINPCLWFYVVANPHADIEGLVFLAAAYGFAHRSKGWAATVLVVAAGLIKLPFVVVGAAVFAPLAGPLRRFGLWAAATAAVVVVSTLVPGRAYVGALSHFAAHRAAVGWYAGWLLIVLTLAVATLALVGRRQGIFGAAWLFQQLPILAAPWYLFWGIPYALATGAIEAYLAALPLAASFLDDGARVSGAWQIALFTVTLVLSADIYTSLRRRVSILRA